MIEYDIRGQICPSTLLFALRQINLHAQDMQEGKVCLSIRTDNRDAINTIPESVGNMGYAVKVTKVEGHYLIEIGRGD